MNKSLGLKKLTRHLLATSCLTVAAGAAHAGTVFGPFGGSLATATELPAGTTEIQDSIPFNVGAYSEWVVFSGLAAGQSFSLTETDNHASTGRPAGTISVRDGSNNDLLDFSLPNSGETGTIPSDGKLYLDIQFPSCGDCTTTNYTVDLTAPLATPEPATGAVVGLALAGAIALRRKRK